MTRLYDIDALLDEVVTLPSLPSTVAHIMRLVSDPQCSLSAVAQAVSADPPLAIKTLRLVNAAYYGLRQKVSTIEHAVILLGIKVIKNLAFTATVLDVMKGSADVFFRHSIDAGFAMRVLVEATRVKDGGVQTPEEAFVCGLLHDIGKVVMKEFLPKECAEVARICTETGKPWHLAEREIIGTDHAQIGAKLAQKWKLPDLLTQAVGGHHDLKYCSDPAAKQIASLVAVADFMCCSCGISEHDNAHGSVPENMWECAALPLEKIPSVMDGFFLTLPQADELMRLTT